MGVRNHRKENCSHHMSPHLTTSHSDDIIQPKRLTNPVQESPTHRSLHRELLLSHRRGLRLGERPELQRVLQQRRLEQAAPPPSDLEQELRKRKQRLQEYEQEELKRKEEQENIPEFVRVRESLRRVPPAVHRVLPAALLCHLNREDSAPNRHSQRRSGPESPAIRAPVRSGHLY